MKAEQQVFGYIFSYISGSLGRPVPKTIGFSYRRTRTNYVNFMKIDSKQRPVSCVLIHTYIHTPQSEKYDHHHSPPSVVDGIRIVTLFRNIAEDLFLT